jgi:hypothetical protein
MILNMNRTIHPIKLRGLRREAWAASRALRVDGDDDANNMCHVKALVVQQIVGNQSVSFQFKRIISLEVVFKLFSIFQIC